MANLRKKKSAPKTDPARDAVLVHGVRTPFLRTNGAYRSLMTHDLARAAIVGLLNRSGLRPDEVEQVVMGTVIQDPRTSNVAREAALGSGIPINVPAYTVTLACISANVAATNIVDQIRGDHIDVGVAGGTESFSDPPIRLSKNLRQALVKMQKAKGPGDYLKILSKLSPKDIAPDIPSPNEFSTNLSMGQSCERLAKRFGVTRAESDEYAVRSHVMAAKAWEEGKYDDEVVPFTVPPRFDVVDKDDGPRGDSTMDAVAKLRPAFDREFGVVTAASSSFLTDGASAVLLMSRDYAEQNDYKARSVVRDYLYAAGDPLEELLLGPAWTIPQILLRNGLTLDDIGVFEIHEAFAAQMIANFRALESDAWCKERLGLDGAFGVPPLDKLNLWGGSLSVGHPFGATGGRLLATASRRLQETGERYALVAGCAAGGEGSAILLENPNT